MGEHGSYPLFPRVAPARPGMGLGSLAMSMRSAQRRSSGGGRPQRGSGRQTRATDVGLLGHTSTWMEESVSGQTQRYRAKLGAAIAVRALHIR